MPAPPDQPAPHPRTTPDPASGTTRLQILSTEHWSLLASRQLAWSEAFSRAGMFVSTLSAAMVALALIAQASAFSSVFVLFALVILPLVLFVGVGTFLRLAASNYHEQQCVIGMNRIRGAYLQMAPEVEPFFVMSAHDDYRGITITMGMEPGTSPVAFVVVATPVLVIVLNSALVGVIAALLTYQFLLPTIYAGIVAGVAFVLSAAVHFWAGGRSIRRQTHRLQILFPTPQ
jgi:hypothetical protein